MLCVSAQATMIKAIIFDLGGVLFTNGSTKFVEYLNKKSHLDKEDIHKLLFGELGNSYRLGTISKEDFWETLINKLNLKESAETLEDEWINGYELISETKDLIDELSKKYKVYFLSDNAKERVERLNKKHNFTDWFLDGVFSHEVGVKKPDLKIYKMALRKTGVAAQKAIFIDDLPENLPPAAKLGMTTILFTSPEDLRKNLSELEVI